MKSTDYDDWEHGQYAEDIYSYLLKREQQMIAFHHQSPQLCYRKWLINYLYHICHKELQICIPVMHLAVYYLDVFMDNHNIEAEHLQLVALSCILVAVKLDEVDWVPTITALNRFLNNKYELKEYVQMEIAIMMFLKWDLLLPTAAVFSQYYLVHCSCASETDDQQPEGGSEESRNRFAFYLNYFLAVSIFEEVFRDYLPSLVGATAIATTRLCLQITPTWPEQLRVVTRYKLDDLGPCLAKMIAIVRSEIVGGIYGLEQLHNLAGDGGHNPSKGQNDENENSNLHEIKNEKVNIENDAKSSDDSSLSEISIMSPASPPCQTIEERYSLDLLHNLLADYGHTPSKGQNNEDDENSNLREIKNEDYDDAKSDDSDLSEISIVSPQSPQRECALIR